jgi:hypothetical protein
MSEYGPFILQPLPHPSRRLCWEAIRACPDGMLVTITKPKRTDKQNELIQPLIREWSQKVDPILVNGEPTKLNMDDWRHILVSKFRHETPRLALFEGTLILLGASSKDLTTSECSEFVEYLHAQAGARGFRLAQIDNSEPTGWVAP